MARHGDEYTPRVTMSRLGVRSINTIYRYCREANEGLSDKFEPHEVRQDVTGHWYLKKYAVDALQKKHGGCRIVPNATKPG